MFFHVENDALQQCDHPTRKHVHIPVVGDCERWTVSYHDHNDRYIQTMGIILYDHVYLIWCII